MSDSPEELTPVEAEMAERLVTKLEQQAKRWRSVRWFVFLVTIWLIALGGYSMVSFWRQTGRTPPALEREPELPPAGMPVQLWVNAELNRQRKLLAAQHQLDRLAMQEGVIGILLSLGGFSLGVLLISHWNDAPKKAAMAKVARIVLSQISR